MHREERDFTIHLHLSASFDDEYDGDEDGYAWFEKFQSELEPELVRAVFDALRQHPRFRAVSAPRGRDPDTSLEIDLELLAAES
jgi:hypothetical protein